MQASSSSILDRLDEAKSVLLYRWRSIVIVWLLLSAVSWVVVQLIPYSYQATTTILAYPRKVPEKYVAATVVEDPSDRLTLLQQEILSSSRLLEVIHKYNLYSETLQKRGRDAAVLEMRKQIKIQTNRGSNNGTSSFTLTFTGSNAATTAAVANELANSFILKNIAHREQQVQGTTSFISDQLNEARTDLQTQEEQLRIFRMSHLGEMPEQVSANLQAISQLQVQYQAISDKLSQIEEQKLLVQNSPDSDPAIRAGNAPSTATILQNQLSQEQAHLTELLTHVTPAHPDVIVSKARIADIKEQLARMPRAEVVASSNHAVEARLQVLDQERTHLLTDQASIRARLNSYQTKVDAVPLRQEQLSSLTRDYETSKDHYRSLLEKYYSAEMASELEEKQDADRFEVLDRATPPEHPAAPNRPLLRLGATAFGFIAAFALAFGRERMDGSIKTEVDLLKILPKDLEFAGMVSNIAPIRNSPRARLFEPV